MSRELELSPKSELRVVSDSVEPSAGQLMQMLISKGEPDKIATAMKELVTLQNMQADRAAKSDFNRAFAALQSELPTVETTKAVPNNDGSVRYSYAPYDELWKTIAPYLRKHGFGVAFSTKFSDGRVTSICTLSHLSGHERTNEYSVRIGKGPPGCSDSQADGAANQYAQRGALCDALNIVTANADTDARMEGASVTPDQAEDLRQLVSETGSDKAKFLAFARAKTFEEISGARYGELRAALMKKAGTK